MDLIYKKSIDAFENLNPTPYIDVWTHNIQRECLKQKKFIGMIRRNIKEWKIDISKFENSRIAVFGAGHSGRRCMEWMSEKDYNVVFLSDNDEKKWGDRIESLEVMPLNKIIGLKIDYCVICSDNYDTEIFIQLHDKYGIKKEQCTTYNYIRFSEYEEFVN